MLIALPNLGGSFTVTLFLAHHATGVRSAAFEWLTGQEAVQQFFRAHFPDAQELMPDLYDDFLTNPTGELGTVRCWPWWVDDRALILGDAAHAIVPFHGQGMNAGFEDCVQLAQLLDAPHGDRAQLAEALARLRKPNSDAIARMALENYVDMRDTAGKEDFLWRKELGFELERRFPNRFIPRYSMVMFHRLPYTEAFARGEVQQGIIDELLSGRTTTKAVDWQQAEQLVLSRLTPLREDS
jgi:kynurenine 3-monooxygenase